jgi:large subunit ribosomal protein L4
MNRFQFENCLVITESVDDQINLSARNAVGYKVLPVAGLNVYDILKHSKLMLVQSSLQKIEERVLV